MIMASLDRLGPISATEVYPLPLFMRLTGLSNWAMRQARRNGLKLKTAGRRKYVRGADWHEFLATRGDGA